MKIINTAANNEVVANIVGGNLLSLEGAIELVGEFVYAEDAPDVIIGDNAYYYDDLAYITDDYAEACQAEKINKNKENKL